MKRVSSIVAGAALAAAAVVATAASAVAAATGVPYSDPAAAGSIGLCDKQGHQITAGSITQQPFAWVAVSSSAAGKDYAGSDAKATLFAYQPRPDVPAAEWSGRQLTAASTYTNKKHPMAAFTTADEPLLTFVQAFPPKVQGFVELRLYLSAPNRPLNTLSYATANLQVQGDRWTQVGPASASCGSGHATSIETTNLPASAFGDKAVVHPTTSAGKGGSLTASGGGSAAGNTAPTAARSGTSSDDSFLVIALIALGVLVAGVAGTVIVKRRRRAAVGFAPTSPDVSYSSTRTRV